MSIIENMEVTSSGNNESVMQSAVQSRAPQANRVTKTTRKNKKRLSHVLDELKITARQLLAVKHNVNHNNNNTKENNAMIAEDVQIKENVNLDRNCTYIPGNRSQIVQTMDEACARAMYAGMYGEQLSISTEHLSPPMFPHSPSDILPQFRQSLVFPHQLYPFSPTLSHVSPTESFSGSSFGSRSDAPTSTLFKTEYDVSENLQRLNLLHQNLFREQSLVMPLQDAPLDLSVKGSQVIQPNFNPFQFLGPGFPLGMLHTHGNFPVPIVKGDVASPTTKESVANRYNLQVSPVVEEMPPGSDVAYVCPLCGQMFSLQDRLAKHVASRHRTPKPEEAGSKSYPCDVCDRSFARSDMLTRHTRLHTGIKPYHCKMCGQVFSRSDHLSTHRRTHTGEKPYKCPQCPYSACRRDMITRHMRTHTLRGRRATP